VLHILPWIGVAIVLAVAIFAGFGWAGKFKYHRDFPKDSWQSTELARAHTVMYLGTALCVTFPLSKNHIIWFTSIGIGFLLIITGIVLLFIYRSKMRKSVGLQR